MESTTFDSDTVLTEFLADYLDNNLDHAERKSFEDYLSQNKKERVFVQKAMQGKKILARFADQIEASSVTV